MVGGNRLVPLSYVPGNPAPSPSPSPSPAPSPAPAPDLADPGRAPTGGSSAGNDTLVGSDAANALRGLGGNDILRGQGGRDVLTGGSGSDIFDFDLAAHSVGAWRDILRGGDGGKSFDGAGAAAGDRIDVSGIDANALAAGNQAFAWGGTGIGRISAIEFGNTATLVRANTDGDATFEFELMIEDGSTHASSYSAADFVL
jgi:hypothetical protein